MLLMTPPKTSVAVSKEGGTAATSRLSATVTRPLRSVTPMPMMTTMTRPSGGKLAKFRTISVRTRRIPSPDSRFTDSIVAPVPGWTAETPTAAAIHEMTSTMPAKRANRVIGSGSRLPTRSMTSSARTKADRRAGADAVIVSP